MVQRHPTYSFFSYFRFLGWLRFLQANLQSEMYWTSCKHFYAAECKGAAFSEFFVRGTNSLKVLMMGEVVLKKVKLPQTLNPKILRFLLRPSFLQSAIDRWTCKENISFLGKLLPSHTMQNEQFTPIPRLWNIIVVLETTVIQQLLLYWTK